MESVSFLGRVSLFSQLQPSDLTLLAEKLKQRNFHKGEVIFHQDDPGDRLHLVANGLVKISIISQDGRENDLALLAPGDCFGEMSILDGGLRSASAVAADATETMTLSREDFLSFITQYPQVAIQIITMLVGRLRATDEMIGDMVFLDVPTRVAKKLVELSRMYQDSQNPSGDVTVPLGQEELSRLVGSSRETVSRALTAYRKNGLLTTSHRKITICDLPGLERMAST